MATRPYRMISRERALEINQAALVHPQLLAKDEVFLHFIHRTSHHGTLYSCFLTLGCDHFWIQQPVTGERPLVMEIVFAESDSGATVLDEGILANLKEEFKPVCHGIMVDLWLESQAPTRPQQLRLF